MNIHVTSKPMVSIGGFAFACALLGDPTQTYAANSKMRFQDWVYEIIADEMTDAKRHIAYSKSVSGAKPGLIIIKCDDESTRPYASYITGMFMGIDFEQTQVTYRVDKGATIKEYWKMDKSSVHNMDRDQVAVMAQKMMVGNKFIIQAYDYEFDMAQHTFSLSGSSAAIGRVMDNCAGATTQPVPAQQPVVKSYQQPPAETYQPQSTYTYQQPAPPKPTSRRSITGSTKGMPLEQILGQ